MPTRKCVDGGVYVVVVHDGAEVVAAENMVERERKKRELSAGRKKLRREAGFLSTLQPIFFCSLAMKSTLIYRG